MYGPIGDAATASATAWRASSTARPAPSILARSESLIVPSAAAVRRASAYDSTAVISARWALITSA